MEIFKFGGASVKDAASVKNVLRVLQKTGLQDKVIVISAMGKMTNAFEIVIAEYLSSKEIPGKNLSDIKEYHLDLSHQLFESNQSPVFNKINILFKELTIFMDHNKSVQYDFVYDQMVCFGELISSTILSEYLKLKGIEHSWIDARQFIKTDSTYRDARINWDKTQEKITKAVKPGKLYLTQGFIGSDAK